MNNYIILRFFVALLILPASFVFAQDVSEPSSSSIGVQKIIRKSVESPTRSIRRDIPLTKSIRKALKSGTRDFSGKPGPNYWQLKTDYTIQARLNPNTQTIWGTETIVVHNNSNDSLDRIILRLDHNVFRPLIPRGYSVPAENTAGMKITRIQVDGNEVDLAARPARRRRGNSANTEKPKYIAIGLDQTVAQISLGKPIDPRSKAVLNIEWHTKLPGGPNGRGHRMTQRWSNRLFQPTQWYPRIAKYDDLRGWDTDVYLGPSEFFNNFGRFDVKIDVPAGWIVSGTGVLQNPKEVLTSKARERLATVLNSDAEITIVGEDEVGPGKSTAQGEKLVWHFVADNVNDFAWATSKDFIS